MLLVESGLVEWGNFWLRQGTQVLPRASAVQSLHLHPLRAVTNFESQARLLLQIGAQKWQVHLSSVYHLDGLHELCWPALDHDCAGAALQSALVPVFDWLAKTFGRPCVVSDCRIEHHCLDSAAWLFRIAQGSPECLTQSASAESANPYSADALAAHLALAPEDASCWTGALRYQQLTDAVTTSGALTAQAGPEKSALQVNARLVGHSEALRIAEVRRIEPGDWIRLAGMSLELGVVTRFLLHTDGHQWRVGHPLIPPGKDATVNNPAPLRSLEQLQLRVSFQLAALPLSIAQLSRIQPGYTLCAPTPLENALVDLIVDGQVLGRGRVVRVADVLGVQVLEWPDAAGNQFYDDKNEQRAA